MQKANDNKRQTPYKEMKLFFYIVCCTFNKHLMKIGKVV